MSTEQKVSDITLAVLPMQILTEDRDIAMFCSGLVMDLITDLSRFRPFQIISYTSVEGLMGDRADDPAKLASLDLDYVVKGHARYQKDKLILNMQLVQVRQNRLVWADKFSSPLEELFHIQEEIGQKIVGALQQFVDHDLLTAFRKKPETDFRAYECWLRGYHELKKGTSAADRMAREYFQKAIDIDPHYARAYSGMSLTYFNEWSCQIWDRWEVSQKGAFEWAEKAVDLDEYDHISSTILGRLYVFTGDYDKAEHFLRKALRLNPNDAENLLQIAYGLVYLGYASEARTVYERARKLNPIRDAANFSCAAFIHFELGEFDQAIFYSEKQEPGKGWVDFPAYQAAAHYRNGNLEEAQRYWTYFLREFKDKINDGQPADSATALKWMMAVNPYKGETQLRPFWDFIGEGSFDAVMLSKPPGTSSTNRMIKEGDLWKFDFDGDSVQLPDLKGLHDIHTLIASSPEGIHCSQLMEVAVVAAGAEVIDNKAKAAYKNRILEIQEALADAEDVQDARRMTKLHEEYDALMDHLSKSIGLGGKARKTGSSVEKARAAVTWRIRNAIDKVSEVHPSLGKHLKASVKTGTNCRYAPERLVNWEL